MFWEEPLIARTLTESELLQWAAEAFGMTPERVHIADADTPPVSLPDSVELLLQTSAVAGDFPFHLAIFTRSPRTDAVEPGPALARLAQATNTSMLISDDSPNPYQLTLVQPDGRTVLVALDAEELDEHDSYKILRPIDQGETG